MNDIESKIKKLIGNALSIDVEKIVDADGLNHTNGWDSLAHIDIITSLEDAFKLSIPDELIIDLVSVKKIYLYFANIFIEN